MAPCRSAYLLAPSRIEFMQRRVDRMHDRLVYEKIDSELMPNKHAIKADVDGWCYYHVAP
jgi:pyridoxine/pyridoxamine 5'-phosphate oxidase